MIKLEKAKLNSSIKRINQRLVEFQKQGLTSSQQYQKFVSSLIDVGLKPKVTSSGHFAFVNSPKGLNQKQINRVLNIETSNKYIVKQTSKSIASKIPNLKGTLAQRQQAISDYAKTYYEFRMGGEYLISSFYKLVENGEGVPELTRASDDADVNEVLDELKKSKGSISYDLMKRINELTGGGGGVSRYEYEKERKKQLTKDLIARGLL